MKAFLSSTEDNVDTSSYTYPTIHENFDVNHRDDSDGSDGQDDDKFHNDENDQEEDIEEGQEQQQQQEVEIETDVDEISNQNKTDTHMNEEQVLPETDSQQNVTATPEPIQNLVQLKRRNGDMSIRNMYSILLYWKCNLLHNLRMLLGQRYLLQVIPKI